MECVYLDPEPNDGPRHCYRYGNCHLKMPRPKNPEVQGPFCDQCQERLELKAPDFLERFHDPLRIVDKRGTPTRSLEGLLSNQGIAFLVCGGPSAKALPMELLNQRGCWSMGVNNVAGWSAFRANAFVHSDPPSKFHNGIWQDPAVMKFTPMPKLKIKRGRLRKKVGPKEFAPLLGLDGHRISACHAPNVWGFGRRSWIRPDHSFFTDHNAPWGNLNSGVDKTGGEKTVCTMLLGMRILYHLGARVIFLVGVDFRMDPSKGPADNYSFGETRDAGACHSNNAQFRIVNQWLCEMEKNGTFHHFGLSVFNTNRLSGLRAFPYVPFESAVGLATRGLGEPFDLEDWYWKNPKEEKKPRR